MSEVIHNINLKEKAIEHDIPYSASIELLTKCNFRCEHCYIPQHNKEMEFNTVIDIIDQLKMLGVFEIMLTGGEIVLHKSFMDIVRYMRKLGIRVILFSNISLLTEEQVAELASLYITEISTSLFSVDDDINSSITKIKNSAKVVMDKALLIKKYNISLEIKVPVMKKNKDSFPKIKQFCDENGIKISHSVAITSRTNGDVTPHDYALCQEELSQFMEKNDKAARERIHVWNEMGENYLCDAVGNNLHVDVYGNVYPCISFPYKYGNIYMDSLSSIWYESKERRFLKGIKRKDLLECKICNYNNVCQRCPGLAYFEQNNLLGCSEWDKKISIWKKASNGF